MAQIKFSHTYTKMPDKVFAENAFDNRTTLLEVFRVKGIAELSKEFIAYDTEFFNEGESKVDHYPLPRGELLILLLITYGQFKHEVWTTVRSWNSEKEAHYRAQRGKYINIIRNEES